MQRSSYDVDAEASSNFRRNVKRLAKRFPNIEADLQDFFAAVRKNHRQKCGATVIPHCHQSVWKYRCKSSDLKRGQSGGYRVICYVNSNRSRIYPIAVYAKSDQSNISTSEINRLVKALSEKIGPEG